MTEPDVTIYKGETACIRVTILDQDGAPKNMGGAAISFRIGNEREEVFVFAKAGTATNPPGSDGKIQVDLTTVDTLLAALTIRQWDFQFMAIDGDGDDQVVFQGILVVRNKIPAS